MYCYNIINKEKLARSSLDTNVKRGWAFVGVHVPTAEDEIIDLLRTVGWTREAGARQHMGPHVVI